MNSAKFKTADYFEKSAGKQGLGDAHVVAVTTCRHVETELTRIAASFTVSGDVSKARDFAQIWTPGSRVPTADAESHFVAVRTLPGPNCPLTIPPA
ncbi:MAG: hypothetical protein EXS36_05540 [Pedosphaera sp.]|nr:hypothetical protein [Pedosphaera sp.]